MNELSAALVVHTVVGLHNFHIVASNFPIPCDGIIGIDFLKNYNCQIGLKPENDWLILTPDNLYNPINIPINHTLKNNLTTLPARSEVVRKIAINSATRYILIPNQEIQNGVFIGVGAG